jgi:putative addiction module component (TIGR02574 family)
MSTVPKEIQSLSVADRLQLLEEIWDSLLETPEAVPVTDAQRKDLSGGAVPTREIRPPRSRGRRYVPGFDAVSEAASPHARGGA